ncbi:hypothetical protein [Nonomuraea sp. NPDC049400]|uniref:hypothetical protein n=1 Tax=Nonomuraea sp. NPDC049400 TaxID=3364352 RepID=UPI0037A3D5F9
MSLGGFLLGMSVAVAVLGARVLDVSAQEARATARTTASVVELFFDGADNQTAAHLEWFDADGVAHVTLVQVGGDRELGPGVGLAVRYDPGRPDDLVFPGRDGEFPPPGDWQARILLALLAAVSGLLLLLGARLLLNLRAARAPAAVWRAAPRLLTAEARGARWFAGYLRLTAEPVGGGPVRRYLQRVYWDPALDRMPRRKRSRDGVPVQVHVGGWPFRRAVVLLDDGTRLWPAGRLRRRAPRKWVVESRPATARRRSRPGWGSVGLIVMATGCGAFGLYGPAIGLAAAGVGFATVYYIWGWYGGEVICGSEAS